MNEKEKQAYAWAIKDIKNGHKTLWVKRLKKERPDLYEYALKQLEM